MKSILIYIWLYLYKNELNKKYNVKSFKKKKLYFQIEKCCFFVFVWQSSVFFSSLWAHIRAYGTKCFFLSFQVHNMSSFINVVTYAHTHPLIVIARLLAHTSTSHSIYVISASYHIHILHLMGPSCLNFVPQHKRHTFSNCFSAPYHHI